MKAIFLTILIFSCAFLTAQEVYWGLMVEGLSGNEVRDMVTDESGNVYIVGTFEGTITLGTYILTSGTSLDIYVAKYHPDGGYLWAVKAGGNSLATANSIALDNGGNILIAGSIVGIAYFGDIPVTGYGSNDVAVAKLTNDGVWQWAVHAGGTGYDCAYGIVTDSNGNGYVAGTFNGTASFGVNLTSTGSSDAFIAKINPFGSWLWALKGGGTGVESAQDIVIDDDSNTYITGLFDGASSFGTSSFTSSGDYDVFVAKAGPGGTWEWAIKAGGTDNDRGYGLSLDALGNCYVTGYFAGTATFGATSLNSMNPSYYDVFVAKVGSLGAWVWASRGGGNSYDYAADIDTDSNGNSYITGNFYNNAYFGEFGVISGGGNTLFVAKINSSGNWLWAGAASGTNNQGGSCLCSNASGSELVGGYFYSDIQFGGISYIGATMFESYIFCFGDPVPATPQGLTITNLANDIHIHWEEVDSDNNGSPLTPDYYFIYYNYDQTPGGNYTYLDYTPAYIRNYVHQYAGLYSTEYFYNITAVKVYGDNLSRQELDAYIDSHLHEGMSKAEVEAVLSNINLR